MATQVPNTKYIELSNKFRAFHDQYQQGLITEPEYIDGLIEIAMDELRNIRGQYDIMESVQAENKASNSAEYDGYVGWRAWKGIRNTISDHIEDITGSRQ